MGKPNIDGLDPGARRDLLILLAKAKDAGIQVTPTSGYRTREEQAALYNNRHKNPFPVAPPGSSRHESGLAVDLSVPQSQRSKVNELAGAHGWKWHGPSDAVHYEYGQPEAPKAKGFSAFIDRPAGSAASPKAKGFSAFIDRPAAAEAAPRGAGFSALIDRPGQAKPVARGFSAFIDQPGAPKPFNPLATPDSDVQAAAAASRGAKPKKQYGVLDHLGSLNNSYNTWLKQMVREGRRIPSIAQDPAGHFAALPGALQRAFTEARAKFGPEAVEPTHFRDMAGAQKGKTGRAVYNTLAVLDYASSWGTDPTNLVGGAAAKVVGKGIQATGLPKVAQAFTEGTKAQVAVQRATRAREAAETSYFAAKAGGAGKATLGELGRKVTQARATERNAIQFAERAAQGGRVAGVGVGVTKSKPVAALVGKELDYQAAARQSKVKAVQSWLKGVGHIKGALLSNPGTFSSNALGSVVMAETELQKAGVGLASFLGKSKQAKAQLDIYKKTGNATGDVAELMAHAPGILDTSAAVGAAGRSRNPVLNAQQDIDALAKVNLFAALKPKLGAAEAAKRVKIGLFDYSDTPALIRAADQYGLVLFGSFGTAAGRAFLDTLVKRPDLIARYPRLQKQLLQEFPGSEAEFEKLKDYQRSPLVLPTGKDTFVNLTRYHPLGQFFAESPMGTGRPPEPMDIVGGTAAGPTLRAAEKAAREKGAPAEDQWRTFVREAITGHFPAVRDYMRWRAALEGTALSDRRTDEPQTARKAALQTAGAPLIRAGLNADLRDKFSEPTGKRADAVRAFIGSLDSQLASGRLKNPYRGEASKIRNADEAQRAAKDAELYFKTMQMSPKNTTAAGQITDGGRGKIQRAYLRWRMLQNRWAQLRESSY